MRKSLLLAGIATIALLHVRLAADVSVPLIEYRVIKSLNQVRLTTGFVHDPGIQKSMLADLASFDRQGVVLVAGNAARTFARHETIGTHAVDTTILVHPATGRGLGGAMATADITVTVDARKRIDCPYTTATLELTDIGILPLDGMISIAGSVDDKHLKDIVFLNAADTIDLAWLQRHAK